MKEDQELLVAAHSEEPNQNDKTFGTISRLSGSRLLVRNDNLGLLVRLLCGIRQLLLVLRLGLGLVRRGLVRILRRRLVVRRKRRIGARIGSSVISILNI